MNCGNTILNWRCDFLFLAVLDKKYGNTATLHFSGRVVPSNIRPAGVEYRAVRLLMFSIMYRHSRRTLGGEASLRDIVQNVFNYVY